uniref:Putative single-stranded DNA-binding protein ycf41 n=1 Tax=Porphyra purpurea TaxID=2787 RepID=YCF41_PORPU|nr:hypothetical protein PopuCp052 [Porphyra purpurea]P51237.1 RecName: Full=Putative single-stranded DNA-binding protein ycf41; AltName: Full=ORF111 [Porphyra purpurea]AAC08123.1 ORF111 [Porphyra purpurea]
MNKCNLLVQILQCKSVKTTSNENQIIKLKARFKKRNKVVAIDLLIWNRQSLEIFKLLKKFDYIIIEGKLHRSETTDIKLMLNQQKDLVFSTSRIFKYKSLLKNKDIDLFIK